MQKTNFLEPVLRAMIRQEAGKKTYEQIKARLEELSEISLKEPIWITQPRLYVEYTELFDYFKKERLGSD